MKNLSNLIRKYRRKTKRFIIKRTIIVILLGMFYNIFCWRFFFYFAKSLTVGFAMARAKSRGVKVVFDFFK